MWERGLKLLLRCVVREQNQVAPHVGAWIETNLVYSLYSVFNVAPHVGAWIETDFALCVRTQNDCRSPCGSVD